MCGYKSLLRYSSYNAFLLLIWTRPTLKFGYNFTEIEISFILSLIQELLSNSNTLTKLFDVLLNLFESEKLYYISFLSNWWKADTTFYSPASVVTTRYQYREVSVWGVSVLGSLSGGSLSDRGVCVCWGGRGGSLFTERPLSILWPHCEQNARRE